jgi:hypothetical protein
MDEHSDGTVLRCKDCGDSFLFTEGERQFFVERSLHTPRRCKACRALLRERAASEPSPDEQRLASRGSMYRAYRGPR